MYSISKVEIEMYFEVGSNRCSNRYSSIYNSSKVFDLLKEKEKISTSKANFCINL
jgi:hypothetical protein